jgi:ParB/RepB/Spo0J family partition protein
VSWSEALPLEQLEHGENYSRDYLGDVAQLAAAIKASGWIDPLCVYKVTEARYVVAMGHRRLEALRALEWSDPVPCQVVDARMTEAELALLNGAENIARLEPNGHEFMRLCHTLRARFGWTAEEVAARLCKSRSHVENATRAFRQLHPDILDRLKKGLRVNMAVLWSWSAMPHEAQLEALAAHLGKGRRGRGKAQRPGKPAIRRQLTKLEGQRGAKADAVRRTLLWVLGEGPAPIANRGEQE